jgi:hypothetical protein
MRRLIWLVILPMVACAYDPGYRPGPDLADTTAYHTDLEACRDKAADQADKVVSRHGYTWAIYWITYPLEKRRQVRSCLAERGYVAASK